MLTSAPTGPGRAGGTDGQPVAAVTPLRVLASEATKLVGAVWWPWLLGGTVVVTVAVTLVLASFVRPEEGVPAAQVLTAGHPVLALGLLGLGVLVGAGDFTTGAATSTYLAVPRRLPVLGAQAVLTTGAAVLTGSLAAAGAAVVTDGARARALPGALPGPDHLTTVGAGVGLVLHGTGLALLALGLAVLVRRPGPALVGPVVLLLLVDPLLAAGAGPVTDVVRGLLPAAGTAMLTEAGPPVGPLRGGLVLAGWVAVVTAAAAWRLRTRDVT
ncbi:ABC-2 type transport system permease protein [Pseudokineococcus lusitanus]|uniref:ABC-2 type transport system permease protein n=1 Tax=Pseudokineococcus lusitanus TaxID=763993 RepID=A0A3N1G9M2_9ACTN|nr:ABC-2 type transport system permease protein [Pseudokineococcus lusitanus]